MQQRLISTTSKVACQGWRKVGRIQHPKWRSTKSSWCSYRRPIEVQRQSCHRCVKNGVCFHGTSKCSMGSAQQSSRYIGMLHPKVPSALGCCNSCLQSSQWQSQVHHKRCPCLGAAWQSAPRVDLKHPEKSAASHHVKFRWCPRLVHRTSTRKQSGHFRRNVPRKRRTRSPKLLWLSAAEK